MSSKKMGEEDTAVLFLSGFVKEFETLLKWTDDFWNPVFNTEINSSTLVKEWSFQM